MENFDWEMFKKGEEIAVHCSTEEIAKNFFEECMDNGVTLWCGSKLISSDDTLWNTLGEDTCYSNTDNIEYGGLEWFQENSYKIVEWTLEDNEAEIDITVVNQEQTKFTYQEVIARIKDGEYYRCTRDDFYKVKDIKMEEGNIILLGNIHDGVGINIKQLFVQEEPKEEYKIYYVEHTVDGDIYKFRRDLISDYFARGECVICNTEQMGRTYGKVKEVKTENLTEKEYSGLNTIEEAEEYND